MDQSSKLLVMTEFNPVLPFIGIRFPYACLLWVEVQSVIDFCVCQLEHCANPRRKCADPVRNRLAKVIVIHLKRRSEDHK